MYGIQVFAGFCECEVIKKCEKRFRNIWKRVKKCVTLPPLSRKTVLESVDKRVLRNIFRKNFGKSLDVTKKRLTFAPLSASKKG